MKEEEWLQGIREVVTDYAKAKAERVHLEHFRKSKKALLMKQAEAEGVKAVNAQEAWAYAHPEYIELLEGLKEATEKEVFQHWRLKQREWRFEQYRTECANSRAERARYGA